MGDNEKYLISWEKLLHIYACNYHDIGNNLNFKITKKLYKFHLPILSFTTKIDFEGQKNS